MVTINLRRSVRIMVTEQNPAGETAVAQRDIPEDIADSRNNGKARLWPERSRKCDMATIVSAAREFLECGHEDDGTKRQTLPLMKAVPNLITKRYGIA